MYILPQQAIFCYYNMFKSPTRSHVNVGSYVGSNGKCSLVWDCCPAEGAVIHLNYTGMSVYLHFKMFICWSSLSANNSASSNRIGQSIWCERNKSPSEVSCSQILDHECIEWTTSELNINHLELGAFPGAQRTAGRMFTWSIRPWTQTLNPDILITDSEFN